MVDQDLINYIKEELNNNKTKEEIIKNIKENGLDIDQNLIDEAFDYINQEKKASKSQVSDSTYKKSDFSFIRSKYAPSKENNNSKKTIKHTGTYIRVFLIALIIVVLIFIAVFLFVPNNIFYYKEFGLTKNLLQILFN